MLFSARNVSKIYKRVFRQRKRTTAAFADAAADAAQNKLKYLWHCTKNAIKNVRKVSIAYLCAQRTKSVAKKCSKKLKCNQTTAEYTAQMWYEFNAEINQTNSKTSCTSSKVSSCLLSLYFISA